jgi:hypothetical protein
MQQSVYKTFFVFVLDMYWRSQSEYEVRPASLWEVFSNELMNDQTLQPWQVFVTVIHLLYLIILNIYFGSGAL